MKGKINKELKIEPRLVLVFGAVVILGLLYFYGLFKIREEEQFKKYLISKIGNPYSEVHIAAKNAVVYVPRYGLSLYGKSEFSRAPLASLTKIMTGYQALNDLPYEKEIRITDEAFDLYGDEGLRIGERWQLADLVAFTMSVSSNDATRAIEIAYDDEFKEVSLIKKMNETAKTNGYRSMIFASTSGLDENSKATAFGSAYDVARLFADAYSTHSRVFGLSRFSEYDYTSTDGIVHKAANRNILTESEDLIASKTGYTAIAGGNLAVLYEDKTWGELVAIIVLGSTQDSRFTDTKALMLSTEDYMQRVAAAGLTLTDVAEL